MSKRSQPRASTPYLLIVEDDEKGFVSTERFCARYVQVRRATTAAEGWELLTSPHPPSAMILDEGLPGESGTAMLARYRALAGFSLPVLIISGSPMIELAVQPKHLRARYIQKPGFAIGKHLGALASTVAVRGELDALIEERLAGATLHQGERELLTAASWVPRADLPDVLGVSESTVRARITAINAVFRTVDYESIQSILDPVVIFVAGERVRSGTQARVRVKSASDLVVPPDAKPHKP